MRNGQDKLVLEPVALAIAAAALTLAACSGAPEPVAEPAPPPAAPPPVAAPAPAPEPSAVPSAVASAAPAAPAAPSNQGKCGEGMAQIPGGTFKSSYYKKDTTVAPFCVDVNITSTEKYAACVASGKCDKNTVTVCDPSTLGVAGRENLPMVCVDFTQAEKYCAAQNKRLVSDAEWEWAARGGEENRAYPWGNDAPSDQLCWSGKDKLKTPCATGSFPQKNPWGIFDLAGNINQWTTTTNDASSTFRGGRGGSWKDGTAELVKVTHRGGFKTTYRCGFLGIRCATAVPDAPAK